VIEELRAFGLGLPEAWEDYPWGERVLKVGKKVFMFMGVQREDHPGGISLKLKDSHAQALSLPHAAPTGYGLGRSGWVSIRLEGDLPPLDVLRDWVEESYRLVAPAKLAARIGERDDGE
jgi:predicted DNA-binding protein (MmcQ/YjbR family)